MWIVIVDLIYNIKTLMVANKGLILRWGAMIPQVGGVNGGLIGCLRG